MLCMPQKPALHHIHICFNALSLSAAGAYKKTYYKLGYFLVLLNIFPLSKNAFIVSKLQDTFDKGHEQTVFNI